MKKAKEIDDIVAELLAAGERSRMKTREEKKNYAERLSRVLATKVANGLRSGFPGILPNEKGQQQESKARTAKGFKKLDVNYSTPELGLGLGISIKTLNFSDRGSQRYTKNYTRIDGELRAEAEDYHERQPYSVLVALIFLPLDSCDDGRQDNPSSFARAVQVFRQRSNRSGPKDHASLMEAVYLGLYATDDENFGSVRFFDVASKPPKKGPPKATISFRDVLKATTDIYDRRNKPNFIWDE